MSEGEDEEEISALEDNDDDNNEEGYSEGASPSAVVANNLPIKAVANVPPAASASVATSSGSGSAKRGRVQATLSTSGVLTLRMMIVFP